MVSINSPLNRTLTPLFIISSAAASFLSSASPLLPRARPTAATSAAGETLTKPKTLPSASPPQVLKLTSLNVNLTSSSSPRRLTDAALDAQPDAGNEETKVRMLGDKDGRGRCGSSGSA